MKRKAAVRAIVGAAMLALLLPVSASANARAYPIDAPDGERYYVYAHGGEFPTGHGLQIWRETNGLMTCSIAEGLPVGHATSPEGQSGLQVNQVTCGGKTYAADTRVA